MDPLFDILVDLFSVDELEVLLWHMGELPLEHVARRGPQPLIARDIVAYAKRHGLRDKLVAAVRDARPRNLQVQALTEEVLDTPFRRAELQQLLTARTNYVEPNWFARGIDTALKICAIEAGGSDGGISLGTGSLVGEDLVLTAHHVVRNVTDAQAVRCWFDYARTLDGKTLFPGVPYGLAEENWLVASSPASPLDDAEEVSDDVPRLDELDFALLRLARPAGKHSSGAATPQSGVPARGWFSFPAERVYYTRDTPLLIFHHPNGRALKLSMEMESVLELNGNGTRLRHRTNTQRGSSGAPCFDLQWNLVALHHSAQWAPTPYNQAVPIGRIAEALRPHVTAGAA